MTAFLPGQVRCTAYWYAQRARLLTGNGDLEFLRELGLRAWYLAGRHGIPYWRVPEGPYWVHTWPEWVWAATADAMAQAAAGQHGDYGPPPGHGYWEAGDYGPYDAYDVIPPWAPLPRGDQALRDTGY